MQMAFKKTSLNNNVSTIYVCTTSRYLNTGFHLLCTDIQTGFERTGNLWVPRPNRVSGDWKAKYGQAHKTGGLLLCNGDRRIILLTQTQVYSKTLFFLFDNMQHFFSSPTWKTFRGAYTVCLFFLPLQLNIFSYFTAPHSCIHSNFCHYFLLSLLLLLSSKPL